MNEIVKHHELTEIIIKCAFEVHNYLGSGFLEKIYVNALLVELARQGLEASSQKAITVRYKGSVVGDYYADIIVEDKVIIECKAVDKLIDIHELQIKNYLKATGKDVGLLLNFSKSLEIKRKFVLSDGSSQFGNSG